MANNADDPDVYRFNVQDLLQDHAPEAINLVSFAINIEESLAFVITVFVCVVLSKFVPFALEDGLSNKLVIVTVDYHVYAINVINLVVQNPEMFAVQQALEDRKSVIHIKV